MGRQATPLGRPRDPELDEKLMTAALLEYAELGWGAFTMQGVARRAGVGKSALYLRWANKEQLLLDSIESVALTLRVNMDTGSLTGDLTVLATALLEHFLTPSAGRPCGSRSMSPPSSPICNPSSSAS